MGAASFVAVIIAILGVLVFLELRPIFQVPPKPELGEKWWGPGEPGKEDTSIKPFKINVPDEVNINSSCRIIVGKRMEHLIFPI